MSQDKQNRIFSVRSRSDPNLWIRIRFQMIGGGDGGGSAPSGLLQVNPAGIPALEVKLGAQVLLLCVTLLLGFAPLWLVRGAGLCRAGPEARARTLSLISCFGGGVFLATCLLGQLPDSLQSISSAFSAAGVTLQFPLAEFLVSTGVLLVLVLEQTVLAFSEGPSSGSEQRQALVGSSIRKAGPEDAASALRSFLLLLSLSLHSASEGVSVGLLEEGREVLELCLALGLHRGLLAFSLAFRLAQGRLRRPLVASCLLLFAAMSPLGMGLGMSLHMSPRPRLARSTLEGLAAGTLVYITFMEILPQELHSASARIPRVVALLGGFAVVTAVLFTKL